MTTPPQGPPPRGPQAQRPTVPGPMPPRQLPEQPPSPQPPSRRPVPERPMPERPPVRSALPPRERAHGPTSRGRRRSRLAVVAVVLAVLVPPVGLVLGIMARRRITRSATGPDLRGVLTGRPAATSAVVVGALLTLAEAAAAVVLFVAVPPGWLPSQDLSAAAVASTMERTVPLPAGSVHCPGPLPARLGATLTCTATQNGASVPYRASVDSLAGRDVHFAITRG
jgi:Domain of unknown function (DUF4333)